MTGRLVFLISALLMTACSIAPQSKRAAFSNCVRTNPSEWRWLSDPPDVADQLLHISKADEPKPSVGQDQIRHWFINSRGDIRLCRYLIDQYGKSLSAYCVPDTWTFHLGPSGWENAAGSPIEGVCLS